MKTPKILIVEDEPFISNACLRILAAEGFTADIANNGLIAQQMIGKQHYDSCLIDIRTPGMNGIELFRWIEDRYPALAKRVAFTSGEPTTLENTPFPENANVLFLQKPFSTDELRSIMRKAVGMPLD